MFVCHRCNKTFKNKAAYDSHQLNHDVEQIYESSFQNVITAAHLNQAMQAPHTQALSGMESIAQSNLGAQAQGSGCAPEVKKEAPEATEEHPPKENKKASAGAPRVRIHTCDLCDKSYTRRDHLNRHRAIHSGVKDHVCSYCNKEFYRKDKLKRHEQIHMKDVDLYCRFCGKHCKRRDSLTRHERTHEKNNSSSNTNTNNTV